MSSQQFSIDAAREAASRDELAEWVRQFLASPGSDNAELGAALFDPPRFWLGPVEVPIRALHRLAGPADHPVLCPVDDEYWRDDVEEMKEEIEEGWEPPPLIVTARDGSLVLEDGNHRVEGLRRAGADRGWSLISFETADERDAFQVPATDAP